MMTKKTTVILAAILLMGLILRLWGIGFGLPSLFHQDEPIVVNHAMAYGTGDLNPHFFAIPPFTSYLLFIVYGFLFILGKVLGLWPGSESFAIQFFKDPTLFYVIGRIFIGVVPGIVCVWATYVFSKKFISIRASLLAAAVMAFSFLTVTNSHYIYTDMLLTLFVILSIDRFFSMYNIPSLRNYLLAGVMLGIATGVKYNGALLGASFIAAHIFGLQARGAGLREYILSGKFWAGAFVSVLVFCLTNPFLLLDFPGFYNSVMVQSGAFWPTGGGHHFFYSIAEGISLKIAVVGLIGLILIAVRGGKGLVLISFPVLYYLLIVNKSQHFARYVLPLIPFFSVGFGYLMLDRLYPRAPNKVLKATVIGLSVLLIVPTFVKSVKADILFSSTDTRTSSAIWIENNLPEGAKIACDSTNFRPALRQPYSQLLEKKRFLDNQPGLTGLKTKKLALEMKALEGTKGKEYPVYFLFEAPEEQGGFLGTTPALPFDADVLKENGIGYISINNQLDSPAKMKFMESLEDKGELVAVFSPYYGDKYMETVDEIATTCLPVKSQELYARRSTGPSIKLYRLK